MGVCGWVCLVMQLAEHISVNVCRIWWKVWISSELDIIFQCFFHNESQTTVKVISTNTHTLTHKYEINSHGISELKSCLYVRHMHILYILNEILKITMEICTLVSACPPFYTEISRVIHKQLNLPDEGTLALTSHFNLNVNTKQLAYCQKFILLALNPKL